MTKSETTNIQPCSLLVRLMVILYDTLVVIAILIFATLLLMFAGFEEFRALRDPWYTLYLLAVWFLYLGWCWNKGGMTVGMRAWRVRIQNDQDNNPGWRQCIVRFLVSLVSAAAIGIGFMWSLFEPGKRCWHDILSGTMLFRY